MPLCNTPVEVQRYGGGLRWHCPSCDVSSFNGILTAYWTNGMLPTNRLCDKIVKPTKYEKLKMRKVNLAIMR